MKNSIIKEEHEMPKATVTKRKVVSHCKRKIIDGKHILTVLKMHDWLIGTLEKMRKTRRSTKTKEKKR